MNFWTALVAYLGACVVVFIALSINKKMDPPAGGGHGHGHDDHGHGHGHDDHGHGHGHH